jgi:hypothetical protein
LEPDSIECIVTRPLAGRSGIRIPGGGDTIFSSSKRPDWPWGHAAFYSTGIGGGGASPRGKSDQASLLPTHHLLNAVIKGEYGYTFFPTTLRRQLVDTYFVTCIVGLISYAALHEIVMCHPSGGGRRNFKRITRSMLNVPYCDGATAPQKPLPQMSCVICNLWLYVNRASNLCSGVWCEMYVYERHVTTHVRKDKAMYDVYTRGRW